MYSADTRVWLIPSIARELLDVAPVYLQEEPRATCLQVLYTFRHAWWWTYRFNFGRTVYLSGEDQRSLIPGFYNNELQDRYEEYRQRFMAKHVHGQYYFDDDSQTSISCRICDEPCLVAAYSELHEEEGQQFLSAFAVHCPGCGLEINSERFPNSHLATLHVGPITKNILGEESWQRVLRDLSD